MCSKYQCIIIYLKLFFMYVHIYKNMMRFNCVKLTSKPFIVPSLGSL